MKLLFTLLQQADRLLEALSNEEDKEIILQHRIISIIPKC